MPISRVPDIHNIVTARLRAAGCVYAEEEAVLLVAGAGSLAELDSMVERRAAGAPLEQILGWAEFCGLRIGVEPGVFVPRRRSEFMVRQAASLARRGAVVVDLCCGSGALGLALSAAVDSIELYAADIMPEAVRCARQNLRATQAQVFEGDLYDALPGTLHRRVEILLANTPYVPTAAIELLPAEARLHEPRLTLDGGGDGLDVQRRVAAQASLWLAPGGHLLVEVSEEQASVAAAIFTRNGLIARIEHDDELGATVVIGALPDE